jgi:hypothetical protein
MTKMLLAGALMLALAQASAFAADTPVAAGPEAAKTGMSVHPAPSERGQPLGAEEARKLQAMSTKIFGIKWQDKVTGVEARGFEGLTDGTTTLSYRATGNAWFLQNPKRRAGPGFQGTDDQLIARGRDILRGLGVNPAEFAETKVLQHYVETGLVDPKTHQMKTDGPKKDRRMLLMTRAIRGIPVWSSRLMLDVDQEGQIAAIEISWPKLSTKTIEGAIALQRAVGAEYGRGSFKAAEKPGAKVESVQAGILHSPAAAFVDEQVAAIRIVYTPTDKRLSMKPVYYVAADGSPVALPRQMDVRETPAPKREGKPSKG